jgi:tetratricopeptide (TPR) repeat protein
MKSKLFVLVLASLSLSAAAFAQAKGGASSGSSGPPPDASLGPEHAGDIGKYSNWDTLSRQGRTGDYLVGTVTVAGGALPWDAIPVTVTCSGKTAYTATTDPKGHFVIAPVNRATADVSNTAPGNTSSDVSTKPKLAAAFMGCSVEAALPGFDSTTLTIVNRNLLDTPDIGTITLKREEGSAGSAVSATTAAAPKDAVKSFEKARTEWQDKKADRAQKDLEKAVQLDPQFAEAWYQLGKIQESANSPDAANSFAKAAAADPQFIVPYEHLAILAAKASKWQDVADATAHELQLNPRGTALVWYYSAIANYKLGKKDVAENAAEKSLAMDPLHTVPNTEQLLAVILADKQDFAAALEHLRNAQTYIAPGPNADLIKQQIAQLEKIVATPK